MLDAQFIFLTKTAYITVRYSQSFAWLHSGKQPWKIKLTEDHARLIFHRCQTKSLVKISYFLSWNFA